MYEILSCVPLLIRLDDGAETTEEIMLNQKVLDEVVTKVNELLAQSPVKDVEKNLRIMLAGIFTRLDLVTREEFEVQQEVLKRTREKLIGLETRVAELEKSGKLEVSPEVLDVPPETLDDLSETE
jgi:BMFP domain-containing protein YqiC